MAMLARRGLEPRAAALDLPFTSEFDRQRGESLSALLDHYAFRLFLRGAIARRDGFFPRETTRYLKASQSRAYAEALADLGLARRLGHRRYILSTPANSFGGTLEWYVSRELRRRFGFDAAAGVKFHAKGVGGDLDVIAAAEGKLVYLELKSSPPKNLSAAELSAFCARLAMLRPHVSVFVVDTALRLWDKVLPMLTAELARRCPRPVTPRRIVRELWALTPHVYAVNGRPGLISNIGRVIAEGLLALSPDL